MRQFNLVLVRLRDGPQTDVDLHRIADHVEEFDPRIRALVAPKNVARRMLRPDLWARPTLSVAMKRVGPRTLLPGRLLTSRTMLKSGEYGRLDAAGFPVPKWTVITPETKLDPDEWGPYVVEKPDFGGLGAYVRIKRTTRVKFRPPEDFESGHFGRKAAMLAQEFIYTGEWPESFRVMTLLGQTILCRSQKTVGRGNPLSGRWSFGKDGGASIVSNTKGMTVTMIKDAEIIDLCERAHREAFPDIPLLGFDVIRDAENGRLYILECHTHGPSWSFSSSKGSGIQEANRLDFESQYDAFRKCARILAEATPRLAARRLPFQSLDPRWT